MLGAPKWSLDHDHLKLPWWLIKLLNTESIDSWFNNADVKNTWTCCSGIEICFH